MFYQELNSLKKTLLNVDGRENVFLMKNINHYQVKDIWLLNSELIFIKKFDQKISNFY